MCERERERERDKELKGNNEITLESELLNLNLIVKQGSLLEI